MTRKHILLAAALAVLMITGVTMAMLWLVRQPSPDAPAVDNALDPDFETGEPSATNAPSEPVEEPGGRIQVTLYVLGADGRTLATETRETELESSLQEQTQQVVRLLIERSAAMPQGVELRELFITSQGVAFVDFSRELVSNHPGGSSAEELTVYSLSNTLIANFPAIKLVKILVEGREIQTLAGHLDLSIPYGRGPAYLQPASARSAGSP